MTKPRRWRAALEALGVIAALAVVIIMGWAITEPCECEPLRAALWGCQ